MIGSSEMTSKIVEVICPNGRRNKVKINPSMTIMEVLKQTCIKFDYSFEEYDLRHQKKVLSTTSLLRYLNLPNNAKLEMIKLTKPRKESNPTVCLQIDDDKRVTAEFSPDTTLYAMLDHFQNNGNDDIIRPGIVCVYMRNEYKTMKILKRTTLREMGVTSGRVAIRLNYRDVGEVEDEDFGEGDSKEKSQEPGEKKLKLDLKDSHQEKPSTFTPSDVSMSLDHGKSMIFPASNQDRIPSNAFLSSSMFDDANGRKEHTNILSTTSDPSAPVNEYANFKFPDKSNDGQEEDDLAIDPKLIRQEVRLAMPCERHTVIYESKKNKSIKNEQSQDQISDEFYDVTVEDLRKRMQVLTSAKKRSDDSMLMTKSMRDKRELEKAGSFEKVAVRFLLPDLHTIQCFFRPLETVQSLKDHLRQYLRQEVNDFQIFTTPPKCVLKDNKETLFKAKLCPAALVHVSMPQQSECHNWVKEEHLGNLKTYVEAQAILDTQLKRSVSTLTRPPMVQSNDQTNTHENQKTNVNASPTSIKPNQQSDLKYKANPEGAPKWFKTGR